ncbi:hypothetical protein B7L18_008530 [Burkholderia cenocepacia]|jgi:hypothetical protein|uniref:hypothetical protein n=1 Tax=Burkholderia cenocepacia TaxID=95486 RepID=UPI001E37A20A|nr:hypothetical protein [Burkholderia cenocepacia]MCG0579195.1 hypothetical protein [Burkholderia cenocepacia]MCW5122803.1 hypothetical protein [Burkholderia cenocepacia]MDN7659860.1 hypothetical protein [Burkholderia cenocepacia]
MYRNHKPFTVLFSPFLRSFAGIPLTSNIVSYVLQTCNFVVYTSIQVLTLQFSDAHPMVDAKTQGVIYFMNHFSTSLSGEFAYNPAVTHESTEGGPVPTRNHDIKPRRFPACPASLMTRVSVAPARSPSHHAGTALDRPIASRLRVAAQQRGQRCRRRSPQVPDRCASASLHGALPERRSNTVAARVCPTLLVTGWLTVSDETIEQAGLHVSERVESVPRALRQPGPAVDALVAEVSSLHMALAIQFVSLAQARRVRAAAIIYEYGSVQALALIRLAGFHLFHSVGGRVDQAFVLARLQQSAAVMLAAKPTANDPMLRFRRNVGGWAPATPMGPSCAIRTGSPVTLPGRHARPRTPGERHPVGASSK